MIQTVLTSVMMTAALGQPPTIDLDGFPESVQTTTLFASVRVHNAKTNQIGAGVLLGKPDTVAYVLTAAHLVDQADSVEVHVFTKESYPKPQRVYATAKVVARRRENNQDLALLRIADFAGGATGLTVCSTAAAPKEKPFAALVVGCADGKAPTLKAESIQASVVAAKPGERITTRFWQSARKPDPGESGGPLVNSRGQLLGICSGANGKFGFYCHLEDIHAILRSSGLGSMIERKP